MKKYNFVDLSGYGASGKTALINVFQEFEGFFAPHYSFEFSLIRIKDGLLDLENSLCDSWSPSRGDTAIKKFRKLVRTIGYDPSRYNIPGRLACNGMRYDHYFNGTFVKKTENYIDKLIELSYKSVSPYPFKNMSFPEVQAKKIIAYFVGMRAFEDNFYISINDKDKFYEITRLYLSDLFSCFDNNNVNTFCVYNACEPFNPTKPLKLLPNSKQIIVDRDPRDIYLAVQKSDYFVGKDHQAFSAVDELDKFVNRYRLLRERSLKVPKNSTNRLKIHFEELVLDYEKTLSTLYYFLDIDASVHINKSKYFDPDISKKGVGMWKNSNRKKEIDYIYNNLKEYCKDY